MIHTIHHTHSKGSTLTVLPKALTEHVDFICKEGHEACKEIAQYSKGKKTYFYVQYSTESLGG